MVKLVKAQMRTEKYFIENRAKSRAAWRDNVYIRRERRELITESLMLLEKLRILANSN